MLHLATPWNELPPRRAIPESIVSDLLLDRLRYVDAGNCGVCGKPLNGWCWTGISALQPIELRHTADPSIGVLFPSELLILEPWLIEQHAHGVRDLGQFNLGAQLATRSGVPQRSTGGPSKGFIYGATALVAGALVLAGIVVGWLLGARLGF